MKPLSKCCESEIKLIDNYDKCNKCNKNICYALMDYFWASREACGVFKDHDENLWFFWQQVSSWEQVERLVLAGQKYLGQIKEIVNTIGCHHNNDSDLISSRYHLKFLNEYKDQVKNPEIVELYCQYIY